MKLYSATAIIILLAALTASSQVAEKLRVTGTVASLSTSLTTTRTEKTDKRPDELKIYQRQPDIRVNLQFTNLTNHPLIILKPAFGGLSTQLSFLRETSSVEEITGGTFLSTYGMFLPNNKNDEQYRLAAKSRMQKFLSDKTMPQHYFEIIPPYSQYETMVFLNNVETGYKVEEHIGKNPTDLYYVVIPKYPAFKITFSLSTDNSKDATLSMARDNWREYGELVLDSDGDYNIKSEIILNPVN